MIGKITAPPKCSTAIDYITAVNKEGKKSTLLDHSDGILATDNKVMAACLEAATLKGAHNLQNRIKHISLSFHERDKARMTDSFMRKIAREYMHEMGIDDTEYVICRHHDKPYPHCHIVFSRVNRKGKVISDKEEYLRNVRVCKHLSMKYGLYMPDGEERVNRSALRDDTRLRHEMRDKVIAARDNSTDWKEFEEQLKGRGISMKFHYSNVTRELLGVSFTDGQQSYSGKQLDRSLVYGRLSDKFGEIRQLAHDNVKDYYTARRERLLYLNSVYRHDDINRVLPEFDRLFPYGSTPPSLNELLSRLPAELGRFVDFNARDYVNSEDGESCFLSLGLVTAVVLAPFNGPIVQCGGGGGGGNDHGWNDDNDDRWKFRFNYAHYKNNPYKQSKSKGIKR